MLALHALLWTRWQDEEETSRIENGRIELRGPSFQVMDTRMSIETYRRKLIKKWLQNEFCLPSLAKQLDYKNWQKILPKKV